jgi:CHAT domain-containing protein
MVSFQVRPRHLPYLIVSNAVGLCTLHATESWLQGKPFEASFKLHRGSRLTLLEIVRSRLHVPDAEFAFLSCCHTAEITEESIDDEALHLTATMQYSGFRRVVGTMWEMVDTDGRDLLRLAIL